jgi:U3 small nucleolar RNA-associated protein 14
MNNVQNAKTKSWAKNLISRLVNNAFARENAKRIMPLLNRLKAKFMMSETGHDKTGMHVWC